MKISCESHFQVFFPNLSQPVRPGRRMECKHGEAISDPHGGAGEENQQNQRVSSVNLFKPRQCSRPAQAPRSRERLAVLVNHLCGLGAFRVDRPQRVDCLTERKKSKSAAPLIGKLPGSQMPGQQRWTTR